MYTVVPTYVAPNDELPSPVPCTGLNEAKAALSTLMRAASMGHRTLTAEIQDQNGRRIDRKSIWVPLKAPVEVC